MSMFSLLRYLTPPTSRTIKFSPEDRLSYEVNVYIRHLNLEGKLRAVGVHIGNEGKRSPAAAHKLKMMGMLPGAADWVFMAYGRNLCIELKVKDGKQSDNQLDFERYCQYSGVPYYVCHSVPEVERYLRQFGFL